MNFIYEIMKMYLELRGIRVEFEIREVIEENITERVVEGGTTGQNDMSPNSISSRWGRCGK